MSEKLPLSRPLSIHEVPPAGKVVVFSANPDERAGLAALLKIPEIKRLDARFEVKPWGRTGLSVKGEIDGDVVQACVVTLDPLDVHVHESIEETFVDEGDARPRDEVAGAEHEVNLDGPEPLVNGTADLGGLAAEYLALGLDPYPRKPDLDKPVEKTPSADAPPTHRPFSGLDRLVQQSRGKKPS